MNIHQPKLDPTHAKSSSAIVEGHTSGTFHVSCVQISVESIEVAFRVVWVVFDDVGER